jgi:hypothetical protein
VVPSRTIAKVFARQTKHTGGALLLQIVAAVKTNPIVGTPELDGEIPVFVAGGHQTGLNRNNEKAGQQGLCL